MTSTASKPRIRFLPAAVCFLAGCVATAVCIGVLLWRTSDGQRLRHKIAFRGQALPAMQQRVLYGHPATLNESEILHLQHQATDLGGYEVFAEEDKALAKMPDPDRIVFLGDSVTGGWLYHSTYFKDPHRVNRGVGGQSSVALLLRFQQDVVGLHPFAVHILTGTNDFLGMAGVHPQPWLEDNLKAMVDMANANGIIPILGSVPPMDRDYPSGKPVAAEVTARLLAWNAWTRQFSEAHGYIYADYYAALADSNGHLKPGSSADGVHPNEAGYSLMQPVADAALAEARRRRGRSGQ